MAILSIKGVLLYYLEQFLSRECEKTKSHFTHLSHNREFSPSSPYETGGLTPLSWHQIPLKKQTTGSGVRYTSALPKLLIATVDSKQTLADTNRNHPIDIRLSHFQTPNTNTQENYLDDDLSFLSAIWTEFKIRTQRTGWLSFELSNAGIANWLSDVQTRSMNEEKNHTFVISKPLPNIGIFSHKKSLLQRLLSNSACDSHVTQMTQNPVQYSEQEPTRTQKAQEWLWDTQYTYARCSTLLTHWAAISARNINEPNPAANEPDPATIATPDYWLNNNNQLRTCKPKDWILINSLVEMSDALFWIPYRDPKHQYFLLLRCSSQLCQAFESFCRTHLCGFTRVSPIASDQQYLQMRARFGLVAVTRNILKALLERHLDASAPERL